MSVTSRSHREPRFFRALAPYLGGKRRLCPLIFSLLRERLPESAWRSSSFLDPFCGGGAVSLYAKAQGSDVVASDPATRAAAVPRALVANASVRLRREDVLDLYRAPLGDYPRAAAEHVPGVFTAEQAAWLDRAVAVACMRAEPVRSLLLLVAAWLDRAVAVACMRAEPVRSLLLLVAIKAALSFQPMSMLTASDAAAAACCDFDRVSPRRLGHYLRAREKLAPDRIWRLAERVNAGVFGGRGSARQGDACSVIAETAPDVLYLDPPYAGTTRYDREYAVLDELLRDAAPEHPPPSLDELLAAAHDIPLLVLSYGGPTASLDRLTATVARHRTVLRALAVPYPHLRSIATKEKNDGNREFLVVAGR